MPLEPWKTLRTRLLLDRSPWLRLLADDVQLPDGRVVNDYLRLESPDYVVIVPVDESARIGLIRSYKRGPDRIDLQPPAGLLEPGETVQAAAERELREEAGCVAATWTDLGAYVVGGNLGGGWAHLTLASGCRPTGPPDSGDLEEQEVVWVSVEEARRLYLNAQAFGQLSTVAAIGLALARLPG